MSNLPQFSAYAAAFEESLKDDDWSRLDPYFSESSIYLPGDGTQAQGREAVYAALKDSVDRLDRPADSREIMGAPEVSEAGDTITLKFEIRYTKAGLPDLMLAGTETIDYENGLIIRMEDVFEDPAALMAWREQL